jgi:hypothetical protein
MAKHTKQEFKDVKEIEKIIGGLKVLTQEEEIKKSLVEKPELKYGLLSMLYNDFIELKHGKIPSGFKTHYFLLAKAEPFFPISQIEEIRVFASIARIQHNYLVAEREYKELGKKKKSRLAFMEKTKGCIEIILGNAEKMYEEGKKG